MENRPVSRKENVKTGKSATVKRHGQGSDKGPVGNRTEAFINQHYNNERSKGTASEEEKPEPAPENRQSSPGGPPKPPSSKGLLSSGGSSPSGGGRRSGLISIIAIIIVIIIVFVLLRSCMCGGSGQTQNTQTPQSSSGFSNTAGSSSSAAENYSLSSLLGGYDYNDYYDNYNYSSYSGNSYGYGDYSSSSHSSDYDLSSLLESLSSGGSSYSGYQSVSGISSAKWDANTGVLNTAVAAGAPEKYTKLNGGGKDKVTVMVYICGSDLESSGGAATMDIQEMLNASGNENVNIVLYTGGTVQWQNNVMSSGSNQIYEIRNKNLYRIENNMGSKAMTDPNTLTEFIKYCSSNYPANRNILVLWDHGGGSVSGYAYDEKYKTNGYMSLAGINKALHNAGMQFDMIGFDTCLMATVENALMLSQYADYLVASEEVEPGTGWYYTDWLSDLAADPSISTLDLGKSIIDSFITNSESQAYGIGCTLSLVDLAELSYTVPDKLAAFANDISNMADSQTSEGSYTSIINARTGSREFGETQSLDQIDLVHFANNLGTASSDELVSAIKSAVKYNLVSRSMSYAYGLSVFFPYNHANYVSRAADIYNEIGLPDAYTTCIKKVANITGNGQSIYGSSSGYGSLIDALQGNNSYYGDDYYSSSDITSLFSDMFFGRSVSENKSAVDFIQSNRFDASKLVWTQNDKGENVISLEEDQWKLVKNITLNAFFDDGEGYIDLGSDNLFNLDENGNLIGEFSGRWLSIDDQIVSYYFDSVTLSDDSYSIHGHVPVFYNGVEANLVLVFDDTNPDGYIAGVSLTYEEDGTPMKAKTVTNLKEGDQIEFLADYYTYDGKYEGNYVISAEPWSYRNGAEIANINVEGDILALYKFTDIYSNGYWAPAIPRAE